MTGVSGDGPTREQEIRQRLEAEGVTPFPWRWMMEDGSVMALYGPRHEFHHVLWADICPACEKRGGRCTAPNDANAALIANAPADLAYLLGEVAQLREQLKAMQEAEDRCYHRWQQTKDGITRCLGCGDVLPASPSVGGEESPG